MSKCEIVLEKLNNFVKKTRANRRMAFVYSEKGNLEKSIEYFNNYLLEHKDERITDEIRKIEKLIKQND